ncbi:MAG TPA: thiol:disulfide interchange protein DsbA/DsbL [Marinospirillum sp.]|uniref:thiol:disulfide interchange protein DsbA/DsbL n=1 Tax=Marinospirillum sp. TaxID=2183934 RepID=UPI002B480678|nr:thiol:disulfide interchange protein DsbA/DsbL [Marinospirillum sp.]HKM14505.1 thiol:disulfide interchange protein DsbA/DsbL [Marinospirillum sp.]
MRHILRGLVLLVVSLVASQVMAQGYTTLKDPAPLQVTADKIEVTAVFSYTCGYCYQLEPQLQTWTLKQSSDVQVVKLPAAFNKQWEHLARAYYIMDVLNLTEQAHMAMFNAIHQQNANLGSQRALGNFFEQYGIKSDQTEQLYTSFGVESRLRQDVARIKAYRITGVPALVIDGRYVVDGKSAGSLENMLVVADKLINEIRQSR